MSYGRTALKLLPAAMRVGFSFLDYRSNQAQATRAKDELALERSQERQREIEREKMRNQIEKQALELEKHKCTLIEERLKSEQLKAMQDHQFWMTMLQAVLVIVILSIVLAFLTRTPLGFIFGGWSGEFTYENNFCYQNTGLK